MTPTLLLRHARLALRAARALLSGRGTHLREARPLEARPLETCPGNARILPPGPARRSAQAATPPARRAAPAGWPAGRLTPTGI